MGVKVVDLKERTVLTTGIEPGLYLSIWYEGKQVDGKDLVAGDIFCVTSPIENKDVAVLCVVKTFDDINLDFFVAVRLDDTDLNIWPLIKKNMYFKLELLWR